MTDRLTAAVEELVEAIREELGYAVAAAAITPRLLSVEELADRLGIGRSKAYELIRRGEVRSWKIGRRRLVPSTDVDDYIARGGR